MQEKHPSDLERLINDTISSAFHSGDFRQLKNMMDITSKQVTRYSAQLGEQLSKNISAAVTEAQKRQSTQTGAYRAPSARSVTNRPSVHEEVRRYTAGPTNRVYPKANRTSVSRPYPSGYDSEMAKTIRQASSGKTVKAPNPSATTAMIIGGIFFAALFLNNGIDFIRSSGGFGEFLVSIALAGAGIALAGYGISRIGKRRLRLYQQVIGQKQVANISDLARAVGKRERFVVRDLKKMIKKGHFPEGHLDDNETMLILTDTAYEQYRTGEANRKLRELKEARIKEDPNSMEAIMAEGEAWILKIRRANDALPGEEISRKLDQLESVTRKIFSTVEKKPEKLSEIRRFMKYYLPTTVKLVTAYQEFEAQPVQGANIQTTKQEILDILDTVNNAFAALLDSLYEHDALDISSDITVLKNMLAQEGLTEKDFSGPSH